MTLHPSIKRQLVGRNDLLTDIEKEAAYLSELMQEAHGGDWSISVNREHCFVTVARNFSEPARGRRRE